ncbi:sensor histidine kinase [Nocardioides litoris]|uniref:sensor histidine kinase n=1 Tax=Nocardioides litoris TaxID=1926648 RepID=UPI001B874FDF|nr:ATP-binding protein [Nocardioides litoris]
MVAGTTGAGPRRREPTLAAQVLLLQLVVVGVVLLIVGVLSVRQSDASFEVERGGAMRSMAEDLANTPGLRSTLMDPPPSPAALAQQLAPFVDRGLNLAGASLVVVVDPAGVALGSTDPSQVGQPVELGDSDALRGSGWLGTVEVDGVRSVVDHAPVYADDGEVLGLVVAQQEFPGLGERVTGAASDLALFLGIGAALGVLGTYVVSRVVKRRTQGMGATEIATLADHREALLHSIREGVVAVGTDRRVTTMNDAARAALGVDHDPVGRSVDDLGLEEHVVELLTDGEAVDAVALVGTRVLVFNRRAASSGGRGIGSVTTLRDRTELLSLQSRLSSTLSLTDTLRAQTHEFDNRLHTISGLVQLGEYDEVRALVGDLARHRSEIAASVAARIDDPAVAALVVAKHAVAEERAVQLVLDPGSRLDRLEPGDSSDLTTVVGNLVDNAIDACAGRPEPQVELWITTMEGTHDAGPVVHVRVRDNGPGVPEAEREQVFVRGWSTKPSVPGGRGIGLPLVRMICAQHGGSVTVGRAEAEGGAELLVVLPVGVRQAVRS